MSLSIWLRRANLIAFFGLLALFLCHSWFGPDIWYHLAWGRSLITNATLTPHTQTLMTQPIFANIYWLFQSLAFLAFQMGGHTLVSLLFAAVWLTIAALWLNLSGLYRHPLGAWLALGFVVCCQLRFEHRPESFSYLMLMVYLRQLTRVQADQPLSWRRILLFFGLQVIWTGLHSYFALGPLLALAFAFSLLWPLHRNGRTAWRNAGALVAATGIGSIASPFGVNVWQTVWAYARVGTQIKDLNQELFAPALFPLSWPLAVFWFIWLATVVLALVSLKRRQFTFAALVALGGALLSAQATRNIPLLILMGAPLWRALPVWKMRWTSIQESLALVGATALAVGCVSNAYFDTTGSLASFGIHEEWASYPIGAVEYLRAHTFHGRIYCDSFDGGYLEFALNEVQVAGDSYFSDPEITRAFMESPSRPEDIERLHREFHFDALLINIENLGTLDHFLNHPNWVMVYNDSHRALFFPRPATPVDLSQSSYWHGETLHRWSNAIGPTTWAAVARKYKWAPVLAKIMADVQPSPAIPSTLLRQALSFAVDNGNAQVARAAIDLMPRMYLSNGDDAEVLKALNEKALQCCR